MNVFPPPNVRGRRMNSTKTWGNCVYFWNCILNNVKAPVKSSQLWAIYAHDIVNSAWWRLKTILFQFPAQISIDQGVVFSMDQWLSLVPWRNFILCLQKSCLWGHWGNTSFRDVFICDKFAAELRINSRAPALCSSPTTLSSLWKTFFWFCSLYPSGHESTFYKIIKFLKMKIV